MELGAFPPPPSPPTAGRMSYPFSLAGFSQVLKRAFFIGCWYTILNQKAGYSREKRRRLSQTGTWWCPGPSFVLVWRGTGPLKTNDPPEERCLFFFRASGLVPFLHAEESTTTCTIHSEGSNLWKISAVAVDPGFIDPSLFTLGVFLSQSDEASPKGE